MDWTGAFESGDEGRAEAAARLLSQAGPEAIGICARLLRHRDAEVRWWTARTLGAINEPESSDLLAGCLLDADIEVRQCAAVGLRENPCEAATPALLEALGHSDVLFARLAADALIALGKPAIAGLLETLQSGSLGARQQAVRCLAKIADPGAIPALFEALDDPSAWISYYADEGLERMGVGMAFFKP